MALDGKMIEQGYRVECAETHTSTQGWASYIEANIAANTMEDRGYTVVDIRRIDGYWRIVWC